MNSSSKLTFQTNWDDVFGRSTILTKILCIKKRMQRSDFELIATLHNEMLDEQLPNKNA